MALNINEKLLSKNVIEVCLSANQNIPASTETKISIDTIINQVGNKLIFDTTNNQITIGDGVDYILISGQGIFNSYTTDGLRRIYAKKNNTSVVRSMQYYTQNFDGTIILTPTLVSVSEGDIISFYSNNAGVSSLYSTQSDTHFTIQAI